MITIENTSYGYKSNPLIFNNISLEIGNGIYGLLGENGVGKTLLLAQSTVHAFGFPFLCIGRFSLPHGGCMGHTGEDAVSKRQAHNR